MHFKSEKIKKIFYKKFNIKTKIIKKRMSIVINKIKKNKNILKFDKKSLIIN